MQLQAARRLVVLTTELQEIRRRKERCMDADDHDGLRDARDEEKAKLTEIADHKRATVA